MSDLTYSDRPETDETTEKKSVSEKRWKRIDTFFLIIATVALSYISAFVLGFPTKDKNIILAPLEALLDPNFGQYVAVFLITLSGLIAIKIYKKSLSWETAEKWLLGEALIIAPCVIVLSLYPQFSGREAIKNIFKPSADVVHAQAQVTPSFRSTSVRPIFETKTVGTYQIALAKGEMSNWIKIPPHLYYDLWSPTDDNWQVWFWQGDKFSFKPGGEKFFKFPEKYQAVFRIIVNKTVTGEKKNFTLSVWS